MGAFLNSLYEEGTPTEIAYWIGRHQAEMEFGKRLVNATEGKPDYRIICTGNKMQLLKELAKLSP